MRAERTLGALNFTLAGARKGLGPFLGVYLQATGFNPAATGDAANAVLSTVRGYVLGLGWVALGIVASSLVVACIKRENIHHAQARSGEADGRSTSTALLQSPGLLLLSPAALLFQTANGTLLPLLAQAVGVPARRSARC